MAEPGGSPRDRSPLRFQVKVSQIFCSSWAQLVVATHRASCIAWFTSFTRTKREHNCAQQASGLEPIVLRMPFTRHPRTDHPPGLSEPGERPSSPGKSVSGAPPVAPLFLLGSALEICLMHGGASNSLLREDHVHAFLSSDRADEFVEFSRCALTKNEKGPYCVRFAAQLLLVAHRTASANLCRISNSRSGGRPTGPAGHRLSRLLHHLRRTNFCGTGSW